MTPSSNRWRIPFTRSGERHNSATTLPSPALPAQYRSGSVLQQGVGVTHGSTIAPSPSVEPPQVSAYKFNASPSPAYTGYSPYSSGAPHYSPYNEELSQQPGGSNSFPLEHIPESEEPSIREASFDGQSENRQIEEAPGQSPLPLQTGQLSGESQSTQDPLASPVSMPPYLEVEFPGPLVIPRKPQMNPAAFAITPSTGPRPPDDIVLHNEVTRHGAIFNSEAFGTSTEAAYQVAIAPPVTSRPPPPSILIDPSVLDANEQTRRPQSPLNSMGLNTTTWASGSEAISSLAPPVGNNPMSSPNPNTASSEAGIDDLVADKPGVGQNGRGGPVPTQLAYYDVTKPTCSVNLVCYRSGAKGCDLQQIQCILGSKFTSQESFEYTLNKNPHLIDSDVRFFREMRRLFRNEMSGFFRRSLSLKSLRAFRILAVGYLIGCVFVRNN